MLREELRASHMTRYTSLQGLIIIIFIFSSGSKQIFAILGYGNVSAFGRQLSMSQLTYNRDSTPPPAAFSAMW